MMEITQKLFVETKLSNAEQISLQKETALLATRADARKAFPPVRFIVGSFGFIPLPVPSMSITEPEVGRLVSISYATHPVWYLRSEIRSLLPHEGLDTSHGRNLYLARISCSLALLGFLDGQMNEVVSALGAIEIFPSRFDFHAERLREWLAGGHDDALDNFTIGRPLVDVSAHNARASKMAEELVTYLNKA